jgi:transcription initiation factor TFIIB
MDVCPNCEGTNFVEDPVRGDVICHDCGVCLPDRIMDEGLEKRNFMDSGKDHNRGTELDKYLSFASQSTVIGKGTGNLQRAQNRLKPSAMSTKERNLSDGFQNLRTYETMFQLPKNVINTARDLMVEYDKKKDKTMHGARSPAFALAIVYFAMNLHKMGRTIKEVAGLSNVEEKSIRSYIKKIQKTIPTSLIAHTTASDFIRIIVSDIEGPLLLEQFACEIAERGTNHLCVATCIKEFLNGKRTSTLAAGAILVAAEQMKDLQVSAEDVAGCAQVSVSTALQAQKLYAGHWEGMFDEYPTKSHEALLEELIKRAARTKAALAPTNTDNTAK